MKNLPFSAVFLKALGIICFTFFYITFFYYIIRSSFSVAVFKFYLSSLFFNLEKCKESVQRVLYLALNAQWGKINFFYELE